MARKQSISNLSGVEQAKALYKHHRNYPSTSGNCPPIDGKVVKVANADPSKRVFADIGGRWNNYDLRGLGELRQEYGLKGDNFAVALIDIQIHNLSCKQQVVHALPTDYKKFKTTTQAIFSKVVKKPVQTLTSKKEQQKVVNDIPNKTELSKEEGKKNTLNKPFLIGGGILFLLIVVFVIVFILKQKKK